MTLVYSQAVHPDRVPDDELVPSQFCRGPEGQARGQQDGLGEAEEDDAGANDEGPAAREAAVKDMLEYEEAESQWKMKKFQNVPSRNQVPR